MPRRDDRFGFNSRHFSSFEPNGGFRAESGRQSGPILKARDAMSALTESGRPVTPYQAPGTPCPLSPKADVQ
jgi:hypothetical protein